MYVYYMPTFAATYNTVFVHSHSKSSHLETFLLPCVMHSKPLSHLTMTTKIQDLCT